MAFGLRRQSTASSLFHQLLLLDLTISPGAAKDCSSVAKIHLHRAGGASEEWQIIRARDLLQPTRDVARGEIGRFAIERNRPHTIILLRVTGQNPALTRSADFAAFICNRASIITSDMEIFLSLQRHYICRV